mgnify:CR=1 FL=1
MPPRLDRCVALRYWQGQSWCPLPAWAYFFICLAWDLRSADSARERSVVAVCVPHRALAASFAALGAILAEPLPEPTKEDVKRHFERLLALPDPKQTPTALTYLRAGRKLRGVFAGAITEGSTRFVKVCVQAKSAYKSGGLTYSVQEADAINIQIEPEIQPMLGRHSNGTALAHHGDFVNHFYTQDELHLLHLAARCRVVVIGRINSLREETTQAQYGIAGRGQNVHPGVLNDLLRIRKFINQDNLARTVVYATQRDVGPSPDDVESSRLAIFDGADSYTKWGSCFTRANVLVILDRTESVFHDGLAQVNARYYVRSGEYQWRPGAQIPAGLDAVGFLEVRR